MEKAKPSFKPGGLFLNLLGLILLAGGIFVVLAFSSRNKTEVEILQTQETGEGEMMVDLQGAVAKPGVYKLKNDSRLNDLLMAAGGLAETADQEWLSKNINLAQKLSDGIKIYIPFEGELENAQFTGKVAGSASESLYEKININTANSAQLESLPGIGPATAAKIINYREKNGRFASAEEIIKVPGIGEKTFEKIKNQITAW